MAEPSSKKLSRIEKKKNKLRALVELSDSKVADLLQLDYERKHCVSYDKDTTENEVSYRLERGSAAYRVRRAEMSRKQDNNGTREPHIYIQNHVSGKNDANAASDTEYKVLQVEARKIKVKKKVPKLILKIPGHQASLSTYVDERVPILCTDIQHLLLNSTIGEHSPYLPLRWCHLERQKNISHTVVTVVHGMSMLEFSKIEGELSFVKNYEHRMELITPSLYGGSIIDELAVVPLSDVDKDSLIETYGSMDAAMESRKDLMVMIRAVFPIVDGLRPKLLTDVIKDKVSRTQLVLSAWQLVEQGYPIPLKGKLESSYSNYKMTKDRYEPIDALSPLFGLDCEMCRTREANELTRVSIVNEKYETIYDKYVLPHNEIIDYMTQFSGITARTLSNVDTRLEDVQNDLRNLLPADAILVGQSLNFDLHALKMLHPYVIDTSVIFNTTGERNRKTKLKQLAKQFLGKNIQKESTGHCSVEDAITSLKLVKLKLSKHLSFGDSVLRGKQKAVNHDHLKERKNKYATNIFNHVVPKDKSCLVVGNEDVISNYNKYLKYFDESERKEKIQLIRGNSDSEILERTTESCNRYNLTLSHVDVTAKPDEDYLSFLNHWFDSIWNRIESKGLSMIILSGSTTCNGIVFTTIKK